MCVDTTLADGHLTYGELLLPGEAEDEVLVHAHVCHPSLADDNLSGVAVATLLARELATRSTRLSYRFVFVPSTIGTITWLARNEPELARITHGPEALAGTYAAVLDVIDILEPDGRYRRLNSRGEPQLGRRGLYASVGDGSRREAELALLWVLNGSDGTASLLDIAERPGLPLATVRSAADVLIEHHLVVRVGADLLSATSASSAEPA